MKKIFRIGFMAIIFGMSPNLAALTINLGGGDFTADMGGTGSLGGSGADLPNNALILTFLNNGLDTVRLTVDGSNLPTGTAKVSDIWFNVDPNLMLSSFSNVSGVSASNISLGQDTFNVGGGAGSFDVKIEYGVSGPTGDFFSGSSSVFDFTGVGLTENAFNFLSTGAGGSPNPLHAAFHLNLTGNGNSGHYGSTSPVPIPAAVWLFGSALVGLVGIKRRTGV